MLVLCMATMTAASDNQVTVNTGVDFYNRYVWRGLDIANTPSVQPSLSVGYAGLELGTWGAYTLSNESSDCDEIDFWLSYTLPLQNGVSFSLIATDYYFPNAGMDLFDFDDNGDGAHTVELGLAFTGPESFPIGLSGFMNVYNDGGNNTYFQLDYPFTVGETEMGLFCGAAGGSADNPDYYGTENFNAINVGISASREIKVSETFSLPLNMALIINPREEISHLVVGMSF